MVIESSEGETREIARGHGVRLADGSTVALAGEDRLRGNP
jgi:hypothetical protein